MDKATFLGNILSFLALATILAPCGTCEAASQEVIGFVDRTLVIRLLNLVRRNPAATAAELYVNNTGLYLLNQQVSKEGKVSSVCAFGYLNANFDSALALPNSTEINLFTSVRLYMFIILLRNLPNTSHYEAVYPPAVLHHDQNEDCLGISDGLQWRTKPGDRIGVFIPDECVSIKDLESVFVSEELLNSNFIKTLCPSQPNLVPIYPSFGTYVTNSSSVGIEHFIDAQSVSAEDFTNVSIFLNMNATIIPEPTDEVSFNDSAELEWIVAVTLVVVVLVFSWALIGVVIIKWRMRRTRAKRQNVHGNNFVEDNNISTMSFRPHHDGEKRESYEYVNASEELNNDGYENSIRLSDGYENSIQLSQLEQSNSYSMVKPHSEYDYDEVYFEPATVEDELFEQLNTLSVPVIPCENLKLCEVLGQGEFGTVYRGIWLKNNSNSSATITEMQEVVAVKCISDHTSKEERVKFLREAAIMAQFKHPNIISILGVIESQLKIIVNLMKVDLRKHLLSLRPRSEGEVPVELGPTLLSYSRQIAFGMLHLSCKSFVHRDLAARNILVSSDGTLCKIADFGLSRDLQDSNYYITRGGKIPVKWTAPEAINYRRYSTASDVWSYGCVLYEIWSLGHKPFEDYNNKEAVKLLKSGYRLPPPPGTPRSIYEIMIGCWHPDGNKRQSFLNIVVALQKPDFQILRWPGADSPVDPSTILGADLHRSKNLYMDLQNMYRKKNRRTLRKASMKLKAMGSRVDVHSNGAPKNGIQMDKL